MSPLSDRQSQILIALVEAYVKTAKPIGSLDLKESAEFDFSPATLRNEMNELEKAGYLYQPHISAGRVPTDKGYRFFVDYITDRRLQKMQIDEEKRLKTELLKLKAREKMLTRTLAKLMSTFSNNLAITGLLEDKSFFESGIKQLVSQPDFQNIDEVCQIAEVLDYLDENIDRLSGKLSESRIDTFIGEENVFKGSTGCSIIISRCTMPEGEEGIVAILGPKRMEYKRNISIIENVVKFLEEGE